MITQASDYFSPQDYTVLVIDDKPTNLMVLVDYLHDQGFRVLTARSGESGIQRAILGQPDIILLDVLMPGIDGFETCQLLKEQQETKHIPIIFMTALHDAKQKVKGFELGGLDYITKPFQQEEVFARLKTHLINRDLLQHLEAAVAKRTADLEAALTRERSLIERLQQALNKEIELNRLKSQIIEVISHEFRTPLTVIGQAVWFLRRLLGNQLEEKTEKYLSWVEESAAKIDSLVTDVNEIEAIYDEQLTKNDLVIPFGRVENSVRGEIIEHLDEADRVRIDVDHFDVERWLKVDLSIVNDIVLELVRNALKFSPVDSPIDVYIEYKKDRLEISVTDEGIGVPLEEQEKIFDAFFRAANVDARLGLGLGLFRVWHKADILGGEIKLHSLGEGQGSRFTLELQLDPTALVEDVSLTALAASVP